MPCPGLSGRRSYARSTSSRANRRCALSCSRGARLSVRASTGPNSRVTWLEFSQRGGAGDFLARGAEDSVPAAGPATSPGVLARSGRRTPLHRSVRVPDARGYASRFRIRAARPGRVSFGGGASVDRHRDPPARGTVRAGVFPDHASTAGTRSGARVERSPVLLPVPSPAAIGLGSRGFGTFGGPGRPRKGTYLENSKLLLISDEDFSHL